MSESNSTPAVREEFKKKCFESLVKQLGALKWRAAPPYGKMPARVVANTTGGLSFAFEKGLAAMDLQRPGTVVDHGKEGRGTIMFSGDDMKRVYSMGVARPQIEQLIDDVGSDQPDFDPEEHTAG